MADYLGTKESPADLATQGDIDALGLNTIRNGSGAPASELGDDGDFYIDTTADAIYGPKTSGSWGSPTTLVGPQGEAGEAGSAGATGATGETGPAGPRGGVRYVYSTTTTDSDPGTGNLRTNNSTVAETTQVFIDDLDFLNTNQTAWYATFDDLTSTVKGYLRIQSATATLILAVSGVTAASGYYKIAATHITGARPDNDAPITVDFIPTGEQGPTGEVGPTGAAGAQGATGPQGPTGATGATGATPPLSSSAPDAITAGQTGAAGTSSDAARADHVHQIDAAAASTITGTNGEGISPSFARADHNHALGSNVVDTTQIADGAVTQAKLAEGVGGGSNAFALFIS